jgi:hypothetical protein
MSNAQTIQGQRPRRSINSPGGSVATVSYPATCAMKTWRPAAWVVAPGRPDHRDDLERDYLDGYAAVSGQARLGTGTMRSFFPASTLL